MKNFVLIGLFAFSGFCFAQKKKNTETTTTTEQPKETPKEVVTEEKKTPPPPPLSNHKAVFDYALVNSDIGTAITALYYRIAEDPQNIGLRDTLASLYFTSGGFRQCLAVASQLLSVDPKNVKMMELMAISYQNLGMAKEALEVYERLYPQSKSNYHLYQMAILQYALKRNGECNQTLQSLILGADNEKDKVTVAVNQQYSQEVPIKAAAYNVRGRLLFEQKMYAEAQASYEASLKIFPEFVLAKGNLDEVKKITKK